MRFWEQIYLFAFLGGAILTLFSTPIFQKLARKLDFMDRPQANHKGHGCATPLLGGAAMFSGWILCISFAMAAAYWDGIPCFSTEIARHVPGLTVMVNKLLFVILGAFLAVVLGLIDDKYALRAGTKFAGQFIISLIAVLLGGLRINLFISCPVFSVVITVFWFMTLMNAINFFDNMDGLAVGTIAIAMLFFAAVSALNGQYFITVFAALNCGVCCGFWFYNHNPATIFMGDSGSHFLGYLAAATSASVTYFCKDYSLSRFPILIPLFILAVPLFDTAMVFFIRLKAGKPFWIGDHNHISHRFVRMGLSRKLSVFLIHLMSITFGAGSLVLYWGDFKTALVLALQMFLILLVISIIQFKLSERADAREEVKDNGGKN